MGQNKSVNKWNICAKMLDCEYCFCIWITLMNMSHTCAVSWVWYWFSICGYYHKTRIFFNSEISVNSLVEDSNKICWYLINNVTPRPVFGILDMPSMHWHKSYLLDYWHQRCFRTLTLLSFSTPMLQKMLQEKKPHVPYVSDVICKQELDITIISTIASEMLRRTQI